LTVLQAFDVDSGNYTPTAKMLGLGANYNLSKNSMLYARYESIRGLNACNDPPFSAQIKLLI